MKYMKYTCLNCYKKRDIDKMRNKTVCNRCFKKEIKKAKVIAKATKAKECSLCGSTIIVYEIKQVTVKSFQEFYNIGSMPTIRLCDQCIVKAIESNDDKTCSPLASLYSALF